MFDVLVATAFADRLDTGADAGARGVVEGAPSVAVEVYRARALGVHPKRTGSAAIVSAKRIRSPKIAPTRTHRKLKSNVTSL
jgi:hypothetical protein